VALEVLAASAASALVGQVRDLRAQLEHCPRAAGVRKLPAQKSKRPSRCLALAASVTFVATATVAGAGALAASPAFAAGNGPSPSNCTATVAGVTVVGGNDQVAKVGAAFTASLEVEVVDTGGCGVAGQDVTFVAPTTGASGYFPGGASTVTVATSSSGVATAPSFTANNVSGTFGVVAEVGSFETTFSLTNTTVGAPASISAVSGGSQAAQAGTGFSSPLVALVTDSFGDPVPGVAVSFAVEPGSTGATANFVGGGSDVSEQTNEAGLATSPELSAGTTAGSFSVVASVGSVSSVANFTLQVLPLGPSSITAGVGSSQSAELGTDFPVPLAVTVTDSDGNDVAGAVVKFAAPLNGPSGVFAGAGHVVEVTTNSDGVATAPQFSANETVGGYVVTATVEGVPAPATFAMVNQTRATASAPGPAGTYRLVTSSGQVLTSGADAPLGSPSPAQLGGSKVVAMASTPSGKGYWLATAKGEVYAFGDARPYGSPASLHLAEPIVGMAATPEGKGYWLVASDGGIFNYGDARFYGSPASLHLAEPIVGMAATPDGKGYWLVASDGRIFNYGDARFYGSAVKLHLNAPMAGIAPAPHGSGYWLVAKDGGVFAFGEATYYGSGLGLSPKPVVALVPTADGDGYWVVSANGTVAGFGDGGSQGSPTLGAPVVVAGSP
jgi:hypothetical protein